MHIIFAKGFRKRYKRLASDIQERVDERIRLFASKQFDLLLNNHALTGEYDGCRSINITGDYRAIFRIEGGKIVEFLKVGTHHELFGT